MISRREAVQYLVGGLGLAAGMITIGGTGHTKETVYPSATSLPDAGKSLGLSTIIPKTVGNGIYFTPGAIMTVNVWNTVTSQSVTFECWYLNPTGQLIQIPQTGSGGLLAMTSLTSARAANVQRITLPIEGGTIVSFAARINSGTATKRGQTLVKAEIDNDANGGPTISNTNVIVYGYAYTRKDLCYPSYDAIQDPTSGEGYAHNIFYNTSGVAGSGFINFPIPTNSRMRIKNVLTAVNNSANAGNRIPFFNADDGTNTFWFGASLPTMIANAVSSPQLVEGYPLAADAAVQATNTLMSENVPAPFILLAGYNINLQVFNAKAADTISITNVYVEEWIDPSS